MREAPGIWEPRKWRRGKVEKWETGFLTDKIIDDYIEGALRDCAKRGR